MIRSSKHTALLTAALCFTANLAPSLVGAAEESSSAAIDTLPTYVVVATRTPLILDRVSPSVDYISGEEVKLTQARSLIDILGNAAGMVVIESGAIGAQTSLFTRGTESNHTAFFMDGRRLSAGLGNQYDLDFLTIDNLNSIQMQRGASTVNYGSSGIGGVVDLRTKSALSGGKSDVTVETEIGANAYRRGAVSVSIAENFFGLSVTASKLSTDNERDNDEYDVENVTVHTDYRLSDEWSLELIGKFTDAMKELPGSVISPKLSDSQNTENWLISPGILYATDDLDLHFFYSRSNTQTTLNQIRSSYESWNYLGDFPISNVIEVNSDELSLQVDYSLSQDALLTTGLVYRSDDASNSNLEFDPTSPVIPYAQDFEQIGGYAQILWMIGDFELRSGLRFDDYSEFDSQLTGSVEVIYDINNFDAAVFAKMATSYAPPGAADIAFDLPPYDTPLAAEQSESCEIGIKQSLFNGNLEWSMVAFRNKIEDMLGYVAHEVAPDTYEYDTINVKSALTEGLEFSAVCLLTQKANLSLDYTYLTAIDEDTNERLLRRPRHMLQLGAGYEFSRSFYAALQATGYFQREDLNPFSFIQTDVEDFFVVRLFANWQVNEELSFFARVENLSDEKYAQAAGYPALGRAGYIGARFEF